MSERDEYRLDAATEHYEQCHICENYFHEADLVMNTVMDGREKLRVCDECLSDNCVRCTECDTWCLIDNIYEMDGKPYCDECATEIDGRQ